MGAFRFCRHLRVTNVLILMNEEKKTTSRHINLNSPETHNYCCTVHGSECQSSARILREMILMTVILLSVRPIAFDSVFTKTTVLLPGICSFAQKLSDTRSFPVVFHFLHSWNISNTHQVNDQKSLHPKRCHYFTCIILNFIHP